MVGADDAEEQEGVMYSVWVYRRDSVLACERWDELSIEQI
jgi:hypothetical protein